MRRRLPWFGPLLLCVNLSWSAGAAQAAVGDRLGDVLQRPWLREFGLHEVQRRPWLGGSWWVRLEPPMLSRAAGRVAVELATDCERRVLAWEVLLDRSWLDGPDRPHALALLAAVVEEAGPDPSDGVTGLAARLRRGVTLPDPRTPTEVVDAAEVLSAVVRPGRAGELTTRWLHVAARTEAVAIGERLRLVVQARPDLHGGTWCR